MSAAGIGIFGSRRPTYGTTVIAVVAIVSITAIAIYDLRNSIYAFADQQGWSSPFDSRWCYGAVVGLLVGIQFFRSLLSYDGKWNGYVNQGLLPPGGPTADGT